METSDSKLRPAVTFDPAQALRNAQNALQRGDKAAVRHWAAIAAQLVPGLEDPWLLLAAVASPHASVGYLQQALRLNPASARAKAGMLWALKRVEAAAQTAKTAPTRVVHPETPPKALSPGKKPLKILQVLFFILLPLLLVVFLALSVWSFAPIGFVFASQPTATASEPAPAWASALIPKASATPPPTVTATATPVNSPTPTVTQTPTASLTPEASPTIEPSPTALPTDSGSFARIAPSGQPDQAVPYTGGKSILVDISEQHLYAYENGTLVLSFVASTGMGNSTRVGSFAVQSKIPNAYGATWNIWMPSWMGIYYSGSLENGIHALPILPNGATLWEGYLGVPVSYGCVVLGTYESQLLYEWAEIGTPVEIQW